MNKEKKNTSLRRKDAVFFTSRLPEFALLLLKLFLRTRGGGGGEGGGRGGGKDPFTEELAAIEASRLVITPLIV